jgi:muramoyltetrapeptide carboxypeptidase
MAARNTLFRIGVVAPASRLEPEIAKKVTALVSSLYPGRAEIVFHPQCFLSSGHFAGDDAPRAEAFLEFANDARFDALWFARGGYGSGRIAEAVLTGLEPVSHEKTYLGYSDGGFLLAALYKAGFPRVVHGPIPADLNREGDHGMRGGEEAVTRSLRFLVERTADTLESSLSPELPAAAFNITILSSIIGTPLQPDLAGHVLMLEEVSEHMYAIDRALFHITSNPLIRQVAGIRLGRCSAIPENDQPFGQNEKEIAQHWCAISGIPYLGRADIGHDVANKIVPFGRWPRV